VLLRRFHSRTPRSSSDYSGAGTSLLDDEHTFVYARFILQTQGQLSALVATKDARDSRSGVIQLRVHVYCDESRHTQPSGFMSLGSVWVSDSAKPDLYSALRSCMKGYGVGSEVKWHRVSAQVLDAYLEFVDVFFRTPECWARVMVLDNSMLDAAFHDGDSELGFYKFYYELLEKWIHPAQGEYNILLDFKQNKDAGRHKDLLQVLRNRFSQAAIVDVNVVD
jgi:hypothetical protein